MIRAAIVGLGKIGSRFDEEAGRKVPWSHTGAYLALPGLIRLVGGVEIEPGNAAAFRRRCPDLPVVPSLAALPEEIDVVSICTPPETHRAVLEETIERAGVRAIWCEKPLADAQDDAAAMVAACRSRNVALFVSYVRRWHPLWRRAQALMPELGAIRCVRVAMPNRLWAIGSHALDLMMMLGGPIASVRVLDVPELAEDGEPARPALVRFARGGYGILEVTGRKANLVVEAEIVGEDGRLRANEATGEIGLAKFLPSAAYAGYRELGPERIERIGTLTDHSPFVEIARDIAAYTEDSARQPGCSGEDALAVQTALDALATPTSERILA